MSEEYAEGIKNLSSESMGGSFGTVDLGTGGGEEPRLAMAAMRRSREAMMMMMKGSKRLHVICEETMAGCEDFFMMDDCERGHCRPFATARASDGHELELHSHFCELPTTLRIQNHHSRSKCYHLCRECIKIAPNSSSPRSYFASDLRPTS